MNTPERHPDRPARILCLAILFGMVARTVFADGGWMLMTADFRQQPASLISVDKDSVRVSLAGQNQQETAIPLQSFLQLERAAASRTVQGKFTLFLINGDQIAGEPTGYADEQVIWRSPAAGDMKIGLKSLRALVSSGATIENMDQSPPEDRVMMSNGDSVKGILTNLSPQKINIEAGTPLEIPLDSIRWIHFAMAGKPPAAPGRQFRVRLNDGSQITVGSLLADADKLTITLVDGAQRQIPLAAVSAFEQLNGPVSWLSSRPPAQVVQVPFFGGKPWPTRMDSTVGGKPIQVAGRTFSRGIGVHAYSRIDWPLDGQYSGFRTQYAIAEDDKRQYADVTVRIRIDGKTVYEQAGVKASGLSPVVSLDIPSAAKMLTLEVDYGEANDTQDRFNWIEPALLRR